MALAAQWEMMPLLQVSLVDTTTLFLDQLVSRPEINTILLAKLHSLVLPLASFRLLHHH